METRTGRTVRRSGMTALAVLLLLGGGCQTRRSGVSDEGAPSLPPEVAIHVPEYKDFDHRPYELIWADRQQAGGRLMDFERLLGWTLYSHDEVDAELARTQDRQLWTEYAGQLTFSAEQEEGWIEIRPDIPLLLHDPIDTVSFWVCATTNQRGAPLVEMLFEAPDGVRRKVELGRIYGRDGWRLMTARLPAAWHAATAYPLAFNGVRFSQLAPAKETTLYLDVLSGFMDALAPIRYPPRPRRPLPLKEGQLPGIHTGVGVLDFPTTEDTVLPSSHARAAARVERDVPAGVFHFEAAAPNEGLRYSVDTKSGIGPIHATWAGTSRKLDVGSIFMEGVGESEGMPVVVREEQGTAYVEYARGDAYRIALQGESLVIDVMMRGGGGERVSLGGGEWPADIAPIRMPYLHGEGQAVSPVLSVGEPGDPFFLHVMVDPYRSNASKLFFDAGEGSGRWRVGAVYRADTAERRNNIYERFTVTMSPSIESVLPAAPNPSAPHAARLQSKSWHRPTDMSAGYAALGDAAARWRRWGLKHVLVSPGDSVWREANESRSYRLRANPHRGGNAALREHLQRQRTNGWAHALYMNYRERSPLNRFWNPATLLRKSSGAWMALTPFAYAVKPLAAFYWNDEHLADIHEQLQPDAYWFDGIASTPPWQFTDYDHRAAGAATFSQTYYLDGELMRDVSRRTGQPVVANAAGARLYAGLADGFVHQPETYADGWRPFNPLFKLVRLQSLSVVFGAPHTSDRWDAEERDRYAANLIAYGNAIDLPMSAEQVRQAARLYYQVYALQQRYVLQSPKQIRYGTDSGYAQLSDAFAGGGWKASRLYMEYPGDVEIWVNGGETEDWSVVVGDELFDVPPSGWVAVAPDLFAFSGLHEGARMDYVESADYIFFDPRDSTRDAYRAIGSAGAVALELDTAEKTIVVRDLDGAGSIRLRADALPELEERVIRCLNEAGESLEAGQLVSEEGWWRLKGPPDTHTYIMESVATSTHNAEADGTTDD